MGPNARHRDRGLLDTNILILWDHLDLTELPRQSAICTVTLAELTAGVLMVRGPDAGTERARRMEVLQRAEHSFEPLPFDAASARRFGRLSAAVQDAGRAPRRRATALMIAAVAARHELPLYTCNPRDFHGLADLVSVRQIVRPG